MKNTMLIIIFAITMFVLGVYFGKSIKKETPDVTQCTHICEQQFENMGC